MVRKKRKRSDLRKYQRIFLNKIKRIEHLILALDMGSGKTVTTLTALQDMLDDGEISRVLIVAPKHVAAVTWPDEIEQWEHLENLEHIVLRVEDDEPLTIQVYKNFYDTLRLMGEPADRAAAQARTQTNAWKETRRAKLADTPCEIHIINKEALPWLWEHFGNGKHWPYDCLVVDEASMFKNGGMRTATKSLTRFAVACKARARPHHKRTILLTGTPAPKGLINLWGLSRVCDGGERLGVSDKSFKARWFTGGTQYQRKIEAKPGARRQIMERMDNMFSLRIEDTVTLPPLINVPVKIRLKRKVLAEYNKFKQSMVSETYDVEAVNKGVLAGKLLQFANGSMYNEDRDAVWIHDEKLEALEDIVNEANGAPILVAYSFKFDLLRIRKRFKDAKVFGEGNVRKMKEQWNNGEIGMMLAHPASIGHGQNIQEGGNISVWYGLTPDLELYQQFNKRLYRSGQRADKVWNHHIIAEDTYDEDILPLLAGRAEEQDEINEACRVYIRGD